jgi:splicing suppressor protein 51
MESTRSCANCKKTDVDLKACSKCKTAHYCGRDCQKTDWKSHKKVCSTAAQSAFVQGAAEHSTTYSAPRLKTIEKHEPKPFTKLDQGAYLRDRPEADTFKLLVDSFRLREADEFQFETKTQPQSLYTGAANSTAPFRQYVAQAWNKKLLPAWWNDAKTLECVAFGEGDAWSDLRKRVTKADVIKRYGDDKMPMQLRMLAEAVYGRGLMGQDGTMMRKQMVMMENGGPGDGMMSSMLSLNAR